MRNSSAQLRPDLDTGDFHTGKTSAFISSNASSSDSKINNDVAFFTSATTKDSLNSALTARIAGRMNAAKVSKIEEADLLRKRASLLDKKFLGVFTRADEISLEYVRWNLDRIDDARYGAALDELESMVGYYEALKKDIENLQTALKRTKT